ncbi:MAG: translocation/assembly module TamB domain-containing protein, partial [Deltaproteobacteria bacterium]
GVVSAIFPGLIEETQGQISFNIAASGTWQTPDYKGWLRLEKAGAFLPTAGIHIKDMGMEAELAQDRINITSFQAYSGQGDIHGSATIWLKDSKIARYKGNLNGKRFQAVYVPEIQIWANPDLNFEGDTKRVLLRGSIEVPEASIRYGEGREVKRTSTDIIILDAPQKVKQPLLFDFDTQVLVTLGDRVLIRGPGIEAQLDGKVLLSGQSIDRIIGDGQIRIVRGHYSGYGAKLDVTRGIIVFGDKPVELASLDIMALRKINPGRFDEIKAGITITGTPKSPLVKLYSDPSMPEQDILSYVVLGRPLKVEGETSQTSLLLQGAGAFLVGNKVGSAQSQLMQGIGIDTLGVETRTIGGTSAGGGTTGTGLVGSKGSFWTSTAGSSSTGSSTTTKSLATIGKYIAPGLYVAYGRSLFSDEYLFTARYSFSKRLEVESKTGIQTGVDLYYKFEFD